MSLSSIYNFFFNYYLPIEYVAGIRFITYSWFILHWIYRFKDFYLYSKPDGFYGYNAWRHFKIDRPSYNYLYAFDFIAKSKIVHNFLFIGFFIFGIFAAVGFLTTISSFLFWIFFISISQRILYINGCAGDLFAKTITFCLMLVDSGSKYSIDSILNISSNLDYVDAWSFRLVQIGLCACYFFSGWHKLQDKAWLDGEGFRFSLLSKNWCRADQWFIPNFIRNMYIKFIETRSVYLIGNYFTIYGELLVPFLYMVPELRIFGFILAAFFHISCTVFLRLGHFGPTLTIANLYVLGSVPQSTWDFIWNFTKNIFQLFK